MSAGAPSVRWLKRALSVFFVYHMATVLILPMGSGLFIRELGRYVIDYANTLLLNATWQFFSPGPAPTFYIEYTFSSPDRGDYSGETKLLPERREGFGWSDFYNRRLYAMRFLALDQRRLENYLVPWICRQKPDAEVVTLRLIFEQIDSVERQRSESLADSFREMARPADTPIRTYSCALASAQPAAQEPES